MYQGKERIIALVILTVLILSLFAIDVFSDGAPALSARAAALFEPQTGRFIYTKNENERLPIASTTKIMTALVALENLDLDEQIEVDSRAIGIDGSSVYLKEGEILSAEDLIYALMLRSANDAAEALAYRIAGGIEAFSQMMNDRAAEMGLTDTCFKNPHGLDADGHYTTAHDLAIISAQALKNDKFLEISSTYKKNISSNLESRLLVNHNKLLRSYDGCIGVKTGYTKKSGRSLVGAAEKDGLRLISVTIDAPNDWSDHKKLLDYGFATVHSITPIKDGEFSYSLPVLNGDKEKINVANDKTVKYIYEGNTPEITKEIYLDRYAVAPIKTGDVVGRIEIRHNGEIIDTTYIIAKEDANEIKKRSFFDIFK